MVHATCVLLVRDLLACCWVFGGCCIAVKVPESGLTPSWHSDHNSSEVVPYDEDDRHRTAQLRQQEHRQGCKHGRIKRVREFK
jgi:hypothetical protein